MADDWPFDDPKTSRCSHCARSFRGGRPILRVTHESEDGAWQFLEWGTPQEKDGMIVGLGEIARIDPSILELADLPFGWRALRRSPAEPWQREPNPNDATL